MSGQLRVAIIGTGAIARSQHLPAWTQIPDARVVALTDSSPAALDLAADRFGISRRESDYRRVLDDPQIDLVDICAPSALHGQIVLAALDAGKHVLCEKPLATFRNELSAILAAEKSSGKKLMCCQHMRFMSTIEQARELIAKHPLGQIYFARAQWLRRRRLPGRPGFTTRSLSGGGPLYDLGIHMLDLALWMMDFPPARSVSAATFDHLARREDLGTEWGQWDASKIDVEDFAVGQVRFANGAILSLEASWLGFQPQIEYWQLQLFGTQAGLVWPGTRLMGERNCQPWELAVALPTERNPHHEAIRRFARSVLDDTPVPIPARQSAAAIAILDAMYRSSAAKSEVIIEPSLFEAAPPRAVMAPCFPLSADQSATEPIY